MASMNDQGDGETRFCLTSGALQGWTTCVSLMGLIIPRSIICRIRLCNDCFPLVGHLDL